MLLNVKIATYEIVKEFYDLFSFKSLQHTSSKQFYSTVKYPKKDKKFSDYLKESYGDNFKNFIYDIKDKYKNIHEEKFKIYDDAFSNYDSIKRDFKKFVNSSEYYLKNYNAGFSDGPIKIVVHDLKKDVFGIFEKTKFEESFKDIKSAKNFMSYVYIVCNYGHALDICIISLFNYELYSICMRFIFEFLKLLINFFFKNESILFYKINNEYSIENQTNIFNAIIMHLNDNKLKFLKNEMELSGIVYSKLQKLLMKMNGQEIYTVKAKGNILELNFIKKVDVLNSEVNSSTQNETIEKSIVEEESVKRPPVYKRKKTK